MQTGNKFGGYTKRILRVNLTERTFSEQTASDELIYDYIGGRGFGAKLLYDDLKPGINPLGEENEIIIAAGPLAGTNAQSFSRFKVFFKSPLTGTYFCSSGGGYFAAELKFAGFDAVIIKGVADKPVYLWLHDGKYELRDATYLWGLDCDDTHTLIREELGVPRIRLACIGPAGERKVKFAGIFTDRRAAARGGGGAVMGAKKLKAIACRGREKVELAEPKAFANAVREQVKAYQAHRGFKRFSTRGTQSPDGPNIRGMFPTRNFREGILPNWERLGGSEYDKLRVRKTGCYSCMIHCGNLTKVETGKYAGIWSEGPEYETIWSIAGSTFTTDIGLTVAADKLCDDLGLDTISTGVTIGFAYELYERGIITKKDTGGLELIYGNGDPVIELIKQIAYRQGFGDLLAEGTREAARCIGKGAEQYAIQVKGLELPGYEPRGFKAQGLNLLTSNIGADQNVGWVSQELLGQVDGLTLEGKGEMAKWHQDLTALMTTGISCVFPFAEGMFTIELYSKLLSAATGVKDFADPAYLMKVGERIWNLERMFNMREGFSSKDDVFPERFTSETLPSGPVAGQLFEAEPLLADYYQARGWDPKSGVPTAAKLNELGLGFTIK